MENFIYYLKKYLKITLIGLVIVTVFSFIAQKDLVIDYANNLLSEILTIIVVIFLIKSLIGVIIYLIKLPFRHFS